MRVGIGSFRNFLRTAGLLMLVLGMNGARAEYPERPIRIINGFAPGGVFDLVARLYAQKITEKDPRWTFYIDTKAGADGRIGNQECSRAPADGYTICIGASSSNAIHAAIFKKLPYDLLQDFTAVYFAGSSANVFAVGEGSELNSLSDLIRYTRSHPDSVSFATAGAGTAAHLSGELLNQMAGIQMLHVPFKGGAPAITATLGGQTTVLISVTSNLEPFIAQGKMKALAVTSETREKSLPKVPTVAESGFPGYVLGNWYGFFAPANLPPALSNALYAKFSATGQLPEVKDFLEKRGIEPHSLTQSQFKDFQRAEIEKYKTVAKKAHIELE